MSFVAFDAWTHEQDIREAAGLSGARDEIAAGLALIAIESFGKRYEASGAPALMIDLGDEEAQLGSGDARLALRTTRYELLRIIFGRRSLAQIEAADWSGTTDGSPDRDLAIEALHFFDPPPNDICD